MFRLNQVVMVANFIIDVITSNGQNPGMASSQNMRPPAPPPADPEPTTTIIEKMYSIAYKLFNNILNVAEFPHMTGRSLANRAATNTGLTAPNTNFSGLWQVAQGYFETMLVLTVPIATLFFIISIYNSVVENPPEEQAKHFVFDIIRYALVIVISANLYNILTCVTEVAEDTTDIILDTGEQSSSSVYDYSYENSPIKAAVERRKGHPVDIKQFTKGNAVKFFDSIFEYITLFLGALITLLTFGVSAFTIVMAALQRIVKPLMMLPFSTIVIGMSACSGQGERTLMQYVKTLLGYCLSGVFMVMALKLGAKMATMNLIHLGYNFRGNSTIGALAGVVNMNLPILITVGLIKSSEGFMGKVFA